MDCNGTEIIRGSTQAAQVHNGPVGGTVSSCMYIFATINKKGHYSAKASLEWQSTNLMIFIVCTCYTTLLTFFK